MKRTLLKTASALAFTALLATAMPSASYADAIYTPVSSVAALEASPAYKNADAASQAYMRDFVTKALSDPKAPNAYASGGIDLQVSRPDPKAVAEQAERDKYAKAHNDFIEKTKAEAAAKGITEPSALNAYLNDALNKGYTGGYAAYTPQPAPAQVATDPRDAAIKRISDRAIALGLSQVSYNQIMEQAAAEISHRSAVDLDPQSLALPRGYSYPTPELDARLNSIAASVKNGGDAGGKTDPVVKKLETYAAISGYGQAQAAANPDPYLGQKIAIAKQVIPPEGSVNIFSKAKGGVVYSIDSNGVLKDTTTGKILGAVDKAGNTYDANLKLVSDPNGNFISMLQPGKVQPATEPPVQFAKAGDETGGTDETGAEVRNPSAGNDAKYPSIKQANGYNAATDKGEITY